MPEIDFALKGIVGVSWISVIEDRNKNRSTAKAQSSSLLIAVPQRQALRPAMVIPQAYLIPCLW
ncbi:MAG: hypothetical protein WCK65_13150, partial [Rhodospirillaceae bacterium]